MTYATYIFGSPNNLRPLPRAVPARSSNRQVLATLKISAGRCRMLQTRSRRSRKRSCSANNLNPRVWTAECFFALTFPLPALVPHAVLCKPTNPLRLPHILHIRRAGNICKVQRRVYRDDSNRPMLSTDQLNDKLSLPRANIKIHVNDLLPGTKRQLTIYKRDGQRWTE